MTETDISSEEYRVYTYDKGATCTIVAPRTLFVTENGSHRVIDQAGVTHRPTPGYLLISWKPRAAAMLAAAPSTPSPVVGDDLVERLRAALRPLVGILDEWHPDTPDATRTTMVTLGQLRAVKAAIDALTVPGGMTPPRSGSRRGG